MSHYRGSKLLLSGLAVLGMAVVGHAAVMITTNCVGGNTGWNTAGIWKTNGVGLGMTNPVAGNTYVCAYNGIPFGKGLNNTRMRNLYASTTQMYQAFPGDSLTLNTNTELRFKRISAGNVPVTDFPGVGGNPGLILNGGALNVGDDGVYSITGKIHAVTGSLSIISPADNGVGSISAGRTFNLSGQLSGGGTIMVMQAGTTNPERISGISNTFNGQWIVKAGWLLGDSANSLGTNSITIDPASTVPLDPVVVATNTFAAGPAWFEVNYDLNSAGKLTLNNGAIMRLHQQCCFSAVEIEFNTLAPGTYYYADLVAAYPNNFATGGSGTITVQPYGTPPALTPVVSTQPAVQSLYAGGTAHFSVVASGPGTLTYRWRKGGVALTEGGNVLGATNTTLTISSVSASDAGNYDVLVSNAAGSTPSLTAALTIITPTEPYETAVAALQPVAFYQFNETTDPALSPTAFDYAGGLNGTYGTGVQNGNASYNIAGPSTTVGFPGFAADNKAAQFANGIGTARVTVPAWSLNTNTVTLTAWINPSGPQTGSSAILFCRSGGTVAGLNYTANTDPSGNAILGYNWNNEWETYNWSSGLVAPPGQWSFVALVITPTDVTVHVMNAGGLASMTHPYSHVAQAFSGSTLIGDDNADAGSGARVFNGVIDDVAVFGKALTRSQLITLFTTASGVSAYAPVIGVQPLSTNLFAGQTANFTVGAGGTDPLSYQWKAGAAGSGIYTSLSDGGRFSGTTTPALEIRDVNSADALDYVVEVTNPQGSVTSTPANLAVQATAPAEHIVMSTQQAGGSDWDTGGDWSDGLAASFSAVYKPGSTYEVAGGGRLRSPLNPRTAIFPGDLLVLSGDGVWTNSPGPTNLNISELRFKQPNPGTVVFKKLVMNGGQLDAGNAGVIGIGGVVEILTNAPFYNDGTSDRGYRIDAQLTGAGTIEYHSFSGTTFNPTYVNNLNITCNSNTFTGKWNVVIGTLLGTGTNALGTNHITIGTAGALETTYDIYNPNGRLTLNGRMFLHQNDTFKEVLVGGVALAPGIYSFAQLNASYPACFPATWTAQTGAGSFSSGSGSLTVLGTVPPTIVSSPASRTLYVGESTSLTAAALGTQPLHYQWCAGPIGGGVFTNLSDGGDLSGATTTNLVLANLQVGNSSDYVLVVTNEGGAATSVVATVTVLPLSPAANITMSVTQSGGNDWETGADWSDGLAASRSAIGKPGSTYEILPGARLRTPVSAASSSFPGDTLTVDGDGVYVNNGSATIGEIRFKHANPGTVYFKKLVMNGGQLDQGDAGVLTITGQMEIRANTPFYVDSGAGTDRPFRIESWLTGNGTIEFNAVDTSFAGGLNIAGTSNTFSGKWNIVQGLLLGSSPGALGPNDITIGANGGFETTYDIASPQGTLYLDGQMFLHQQASFKSVVINGSTLAAGTYTYAQLAAAYPANFPASWTPHVGAEAYSAASGSLTVLGATPVDVRIEFGFSNSSLTLTWSQGILLEADQVTGPWTTNNAPSPFTVTPNAERKFYRVLVQ